MPTNYPLDVVLTNALRGIVVNTVLPAVNAALAYYIGQDTGVPVLTIAASSIAEGTTPVPGSVTMDVEIVDCQEYPDASGLFLGIFNTQMTLKIPSVLNNRPEDFILVGNCFHDEMRQAFNNGDTYNIVPVNPSGNRSLPSGIAFTDCRMVRMIHPPAAVMSDDKVTRAYNWRFYHHSEITYPMTR